MELKFTSDTKHRKQWFTGLSFSHPAKMALPLQLWLIENYTKEGETILDPMAGSGTILVACSMGRNVITVELEDKFVQMQKGNWAKIRQRGAQLGYQMGTATILQGDARNLTGLLCGSVIMSPPYADSPGTPSLGSVNKDDWGHEGKDIVTRRGLERGYSKDTEGQIGNLKSDFYLPAMLQIYQQCHAVLRLGGLLILVTKNFIRNKAIVRLDLDTIKICEKVGFTFKERHYRKLLAQSFWRVIYAKHHPNAPVLDKEDILVFQKRSKGIKVSI